MPLREPALRSRTEGMRGARVAPHNQDPPRGLRPAGSRLAARGGLKPLAAVAGLSLVERAIVTAHAAGADEFYLVCGHNCRKLVAHLEDVARRRSLVIHPVFNADYRKGNGLSVLCAREFLAAEPRFGLLMADHVFEPELLCGLFR